MCTVPSSTNHGLFRSPSLTAGYVLQSGRLGGTVLHALKLVYPIQSFRLKKIEQKSLNLRHRQKRLDSIRLVNALMMVSFLLKFEETFSIFFSSAE